MAKTTTASNILQLPAPSRVDGGANAMLASTLRKKFKTVTVYEPDGETVKAEIIVESGEPSKIAGSYYNYFLTLCDAWLSGVGQGPDGSRLYVDEHTRTIQSDSKANIKEFILEAVPDGRAGLTGYRATVGEVLGVVTGQARIIRSSLEKFDTVRRTTRESTKTEEAPDILF